jgi:Tol biopolymer transport system component
LALVAVSGVTWWIARRPLPTTRLQFALAVPDEMSISHMALSSDGSMLVFVSPEENSALPMLYTQRVGSSSVTLLPGTQGASYPFWSPDGAYVGFFANGKLQKIAVAGGTTQVLAVAPAGRGGSWGSKGVIIYSPDAQSPLQRINPDGTGIAPVTLGIRAADDQSHRWPVFLPDGDHFLFWAGNFGNLKDDRSSGIYASSLEAKERKLVVLAHSSFSYDAHNLFYADDQRQLVSIAFDPSAGRVSGSTSVVANAVGFQPSTYWAAFTVAQNGTLIYNTGVGAAQSELTWLDRSGKELGRIGDPGVMANPTLSPDGTRVAVDISDQKANNVDIWIESTTGAANSRFTFDPSEEVVGVWSRDGSMLAYRIAAPEGTGLYLKSTTGLEREKKRYTAPKSAMDDILANSWSLDDRQILCTRQTSLGDHLELLPADSGEPTRFLTTTGNTNNGQISPDGKWVAYASDESGNWEIYVTSFPGAAGKWQVSRGGGTEPRWRGDGKEIFYISPSGTLMAVSVNGETTFATGTPATLFQVHGRAPISSTDIFTYDVAKDGKRFLVNRYVKPEHIPPLTILLETPASPSSR